MQKSNFQMILQEQQVVGIITKSISNLKKETTNTNRSACGYWNIPHGITIFLLANYRYSINRMNVKLNQSSFCQNIFVLKTTVPTVFHVKIKLHCKLFKKWTIWLVNSNFCLSADSPENSADATYYTIITNKISYYSISPVTMSAKLAEIISCYKKEKK